MLGYRFDVWDWTYEIKLVSINRFMVKFPSDELLDQAVQLSPVNLGSFVGRFRLWREDLRLRALPYPMFRWIRLFNLPYHLWELEFLQSLFEGIGQCVYCSADVTTKTNFRDCRVLLEIREYSDIPKRIRFRYTSPMDRRLMEGFVVTQLVGGDREQQANNEQGPNDMSVDQPQSQQPQPSRADPELIEVSWDGRQMTVEKELWQRFLRAQGVGPSTLPRDRGSYHDRASSKGSGGGAVGP
ncbi:uncharacterized protein LOC109832600 [Asparagus officinalis]|uniref:uncharacterized protein LOC109832600 n=1 Tax=Asparagus officinalis TaxID=4686 RepID=UPI00098E7DD1|nr:uncharacterized protein LOC109832600 [Asparagus officinalis]